MFVGQMTECQNCGWKGMAGDGRWTCPDCDIEWQEFSLTIPAGKVQEALDAIAPVLRPLIPEDARRKAQREQGRGA